MTNDRRSVNPKQLCHLVLSQPYSIFFKLYIQLDFSSAERYISILFSSLSIVVSLFCITPIGFLPILSLCVAMILALSLLSSLPHEAIP